MASAGFGCIREVCWIFTLIVLIDISGGVHVYEVSQPIRGKDSDSMAVLPCDFRTKKHDTAIISWYLEKGRERILVGRFDNHNRLWSYGEFQHRVTRGDLGALVLQQPKGRDSGNYTCEVEVDVDETPYWMKTTVTLEITDGSDVNTARNPPQYATALISVYWLISVMCALLLSAVRRTLAMSNCCRHLATSRTQGRSHALSSLIIVLAIGLIFAGVICASISVNNLKTVLDNSYWTVSVITGISGILILLVITVWSVLPADSCCKRKCAAKSSDKETHEESPAQSMAVSYIASTKTESAGSRLIMPTTNTSAVKGGCAAPSVESTSKLSVGDIKTLTIPDNNRVTGMVSWEHNEVYVTTTSTLFKMNVTDKGEINFESKFKRQGEINFESKFKRQEEFLSLGKYKGSLLICIEEKLITDKCFLIKWVPSSGKYEKNLLQVQSIIKWVQEGRGDGLAYVALCNPDVISKRDLEKKTGEQIWTSVLKKPECIVQNSRGQFIVADSGKNDLFVFGEDGEFLSTMKETVPKEYEDKLRMCNRIAVGEDDRVFVSSPESNDVLLFSKDFRFERLFPAFIASKPAISCLLVHNGSLYVAHGNNIFVYPIYT